MKHTDIKAFVRKYNSEFAIRGYSKMRKADLLSAVTTALSRSRKEIKAEWKQMKGESSASSVALQCKGIWRVCRKYVANDKE